MTTTQTYPEPELFALPQQKDEAAFCYLYDHHAGALNGNILQIIPDQALPDEEWQEVFVNIWRGMDSYAGPAKDQAPWYAADKNVGCQ
ncbi:hypothetical protein ACFSQD_12230 [Flavihumibacter stibioxidans]|uniref:Uncharacterized protein n=1 Tax=Flavihumibacter stibioxidans TaxID=1834163 RepID=A0ABR7MAL0_9BACT|nr:hypothetical protein [Flavihumibacter stibioxidans]MBC6491603.1 hypothetical protein [Flavihumibacter stibioxidans]